MCYPEFSRVKGTPVDFGPLTLGQEGIGYRGSHLSWALFEHLDTCEVTGKLAIQQRTSFGGRKPWVVVECDLVPNIALLHHLIGSIVSPTAPDNPLVFSTPSPLVAGKQATVTYQGYLTPGASAITMHWGYNTWSEITDTSLYKQENDLWMATISVPPDATILNISFYDQCTIWDNNQTHDYHLRVTDTSPVPLTRALFAHGG